MKRSWPVYLIWAMSAQCFVAGIAFASQRQFKLASYWLLVSAINFVASLLD